MSIFYRSNVQVAHYLSTNCNMIIAERNFPLSCHKYKNRHHLNISLSAQWRSLKYTDHNIIVRRKHKATLGWVAWRTTLITEPWYVPYFLLRFWKDSTYRSWRWLWANVEGGLWLVSEPWCLWHVAPGSRVTLLAYGCGGCHCHSVSPYLASLCKRMAVVLVGLKWHGNVRVMACGL